MSSDSNPIHEAKDHRSRIAQHPLGAQAGGQPRPGVALQLRIPSLAAVLFRASPASTTAPSCPGRAASSGCSAPRAWTGSRTCTWAAARTASSSRSSRSRSNLTCDDPEVRRFEYAYDPRVTLVDGVHYVTWCNGYHGPTIGIARTTDFVHFEQLENAFLPYNRNGVLFPRKFGKNFLMLSRPSDTGHTPFGDIFVSESPDLVHWGRHRHVIGRGGPWWQGTKIGAGPVADRDERGMASLLPRRHDDLQRLRVLDRRDAARPRRAVEGHRLREPAADRARGALRADGLRPGRLFPGGVPVRRGDRPASRSTTGPPTPSPRSASATRRRSCSSSKDYPLKK